MPISHFSIQRGTCFERNSKKAGNEVRQLRKQINKRNAQPEDTDFADGEDTLDPPGMAVKKAFADSNV